jgi:choline dehydrogenase-like flavoprotein
MRQAETFDAIVVGSGISGGWAAKELTERGLRVLLLERGRTVEHQKDYKNARKGPWEYPYRAGRNRAMVEAYPVLSRDYPLNERNLDWWVNEQESPYTEVKRFDWYRGYHLGGRSLTWGRQSYRLSDLDFEANAREGVAVDWPVRYADIAPWYDHVERHAGVSGSLEGLPQLPDGQFQPAMPLNCAEAAIAARIASKFERRRMIPGRAANLTRPLPGRGRCLYRNACALGCPSGSYFSTQSSTLPFAMATNRLTLRTHAIATEVLYDRDRRRANGVRVMDALTRATTDYSAKVVFLCASTLNSTWLLMRSATDVWPDGLGSSSGELGRNLMDHHFRCGPTAFTSLVSETCSATSAATCEDSAIRVPRTARDGSARSRNWASVGRSRTPPASPVRGRLAAPPSARCCPTMTTRCSSIRRGRTNGACR